MYFEWCHVQHHGAAHTASSTVNNLVHHGRRVPLNPLGNTGLVFDIAFFEIVAKSVHEKIEFKGIVYEGETSTILYQLPKRWKRCPARASVFCLAGWKSYVLDTGGTSEEEAG